MLKSILPDLEDISVWFNELSVSLTKYEIVSKLEVSAFIAQTAIESGYYSHLKEDLNYSESGLLTVFPTHFNQTEVETYAHNPEMIANRVYASRYGNGDESSGDGYRFCGKGLIQVTFKSNYESYSQWAYGNKNILNNPELLTQPHDAIMSAIWFWKTRGLSDLAQKSDMVSITKKINGGVNDLSQRLGLYKKVISIL
jgi:putative chitinase